MANVMTKSNNTNSGKNPNPVTVIASNVSKILFSGIN